MLNYFPKWIVMIVAIGVAVFEVAARLPDVMLFSQRMTGEVGKYGGEAQSSAAVAAQIEQTQAAAEQAQTQARLNAMQTQVTQLEGQLTQAQIAKTDAEKRLTQVQTTGANLDNATSSLGLALGGAILGPTMKLFQAFSGNNGSAAGTSQNSAPDAAQPHYATVRAINLNLRSGPGVSYPSLGIMPQGTRVVVVREAEDGWLEIEARGQDGGTLHGFASGQHLNME